MNDIICLLLPTGSRAHSQSSDEEEVFCMFDWLNFELFDERPVEFGFWFIITFLLCLVGSVWIYNMIRKGLNDSEARIRFAALVGVTVFVISTPVSWALLLTLNP